MSQTKITQNGIYPILATGSTTARTLADRFADVVNVKDFGAVGNAGISGTSYDVVDDSGAFQLANDYLASRGGGTITYSGGRYYIGNSINISRNVSICGNTRRADCGNPFGITTDYFSSLKVVPALILNTTATINLSSGSGISSVFIFRKGLSLDGSDMPYNYSGTAIAANLADSIYIDNSSIIGFQYAIYKTNCSRSRISDVLIDCNNGIVDNGAGDINRYNDVHCYGVIQNNATGHDAFSTRSGNGFYFGTSKIGGPIINGCFTYGFQVGLNLNVDGSYTVNDCWIDGPYDTNYNPLSASSIGIFYGNSITNAESQITNTKIVSQGTAFYAASGNYGVIHLSDIIIHHCNVGINCYANNLNAENLTIRGYANNGIIFNYKAEADTAKITNLLMYDRGLSAVDFNAGGGNPNLNNIGYIDGTLNVLNYFCENYTPSSGIINFLNGKTFAYISGSDTINDIFPKYDGLVVNLQFNSSGLTFSSSTFRISGSSFTSLVGSCISFRYNISDSKWYEISRSL